MTRLYSKAHYLIASMYALTLTYSFFNAVIFLGIVEYLYDHFHWIRPIIIFSLIAFVITGVAYIWLISKCKCDACGHNVMLCNHAEMSHSTKECNCNQLETNRTCGLKNMLKVIRRNDYSCAYCGVEYSGNRER